MSVFRSAQILTHHKDHKGKERIHFVLLVVLVVKTAVRSLMRLFVTLPPRQIDTTRFHSARRRLSAPASHRRRQI